MRADALGVYGAAGNPTPAIDALAARGFRFKDLTAPAPWTLPSFATLHTGLQPQTHGAGRRFENEGTDADHNFSPLPEGARTLAEVLAEAGFATSGYYSNPYLRAEFGLHQGFADYQTVREMGRAGPTVNAAMSWLRSHQDEPFFLFVHVIDPHVPYIPPDAFCREWVQAKDPAWAKKPCILHRPPGEPLAEEERPWARALYQAEVAYVDHQIGRLLAELETLGLTESTLVVLVSDHGESFWEHEEQTASLGYRQDTDHGQHLYRELIQVPAILAYPGWVDAGWAPQVLEEPAELADLFPTLLNLLGVAAPPNQGRDLSPWLRGEPMEAGAPLRIADFLLYGEPRTAARDGAWKLIYKSEEPEVRELLNLDEDPREQVNRIADEPRIAERLLRRSVGQVRERRRLVQQMGIGEPTPTQMTEEAREQLRSLGYVD